MPIRYNFEAARKAGMTDKDIVDHIQNNFSGEAIFTATGPLKYDFAKARKAGMPDSEIVDFLSFTPPPAAEDDRPDVSRGFGIAFDQLSQLGWGLFAGMGAAAESLFGEGGISTGVKKYGVQKYQEWNEAIAADSKPSDSLTYSWEQAQQGNLGALVDWLQYGIGYAGAQGVQALASFGIGGVVGKAVAKGAVTKLAAGMIEKESAKILEAQAGKKLTEEALKEAAEAYGKEKLVSLSTANVAAKFGQYAGMGAQSFGMEGGEIFGGLAEKSVKEGRALNGEELAKAFGATIAAGSLEFVGDKLGVDIVLGKSRLLKGAPAMTGWPGKAARGATAAALAMPVEAGTEFAQTYIEEIGKGEPLTDETLKHAIDAAGLGAVGGGQAGIIGGAMSKPVPATAPSDIPPTTEEQQAATIDIITDPGKSLDESIAAAHTITKTHGENVAATSPSLGIIGAGMSEQAQAQLAEALARVNAPAITAPPSVPATALQQDGTTGDGEPPIAPAPTPGPTAPIVPGQGPTGVTSVVDPAKLAAAFPDSEETLRLATERANTPEQAAANIIADKVGQKADAANGLAKKAEEKGSPELAALAEKTKQEAIANGEALKHADGPLTEALVDQQLAKIAPPSPATPTTIKEYAASLGLKWPIKRSDPNYIKVSDEWAALQKQGIVEAELAKVENIIPQRGRYSETVNRLQTAILKDDFNARDFVLKRGDRMGVADAVDYLLSDTAYIERIDAKLKAKLRAVQKEVSKDVTPDQLAKVKGIAEPAPKAKQPWEMTREEAERFTAAEDARLKSEQFEKIKVADHNIIEAIENNGGVLEYGESGGAWFTITRDKNGYHITDNRQEYSGMGMPTRQSFSSKNIRDITEWVNNRNKAYSERGTFEIWGEDSHEDLVRQALAEGKSIPKFVLADYPELAASALKTPQAAKGYPSISEGNLNSLSSNTKSISNIAKSETFSQQGLSSFDIPTQRLVLNRVFASLHQPQIRDIVIKTIPVDVVDNLIRQKLPANVVLHDPAVDKNFVTGLLGDGISLRRDTADSLVSRIASLTTEKKLGTAQAVGDTLKDIPALSASDLYHNFSIAQTTSKGKPEVLKDYPDLAPKAEVAKIEKGAIVTVSLGGREYPNTRILRKVEAPDGIKYQVDIFGLKFIPIEQITYVKPTTVKPTTKLASDTTYINKKPANWRESEYRTQDFDAAAESDYKKAHAAISKARAEQEKIGKALGGRQITPEAQKAYDKQQAIRDKAEETMEAAEKYAKKAKSPDAGETTSPLSTGSTVKGKTPRKVAFPKNMSMLQFAASIGGFNRASVAAEFGLTDEMKVHKSGIFGHPAFRVTGGRTFDDMGQALAEAGYLPKDEHGKYSKNDLSDRLSFELKGKKQYGANAVATELDELQAEAGSIGVGWKEDTTEDDLYIAIEAKRSSLSSVEKSLFEEIVVEDDVDIDFDFGFNKPIVAAQTEEWLEGVENADDNQGQVNGAPTGVQGEGNQRSAERGGTQGETQQPPAEGAFTLEGQKVTKPKASDAKQAEMFQIKPQVPASGLATEDVGNPMLDEIRAREMEKAQGGLFEEGKPSTAAAHLREAARLMDEEAKPDAETIKNLVLSQGGMFGLAGDRNKALRQQIMSLLLGRKAKSTEYGVTAVEDALYKYAGIDKSSMTTAQARDEFDAWVKEEEPIEHVVRPEADRGADEAEQPEEDRGLPDSARRIEGRAEAEGAGSVAEELPTDIAFARSSPSAQPWYFSQLERAVEQAPDKIFSTGKQVAVWLQANKGKLGVKDEELHWTGTLDWLNMQGSRVSKADVLVFLKGNGVQVNVAEKGAPTHRRIQARADEIFEEMVNERISEMEEKDDIDPDEIDRADVSNLFDWDDAYTLAENELTDADGPQFAQWIPPGGEEGTYREILLTLPIKKDTKQRYSIAPDGNIYRVYDSAGEIVKSFRTLGEAERYRENILGDTGFDVEAPTFRASHFDEPNILAHLRVDEVTGEDGKRYLRVIEIQSDWGQKGRKEGFRDAEARKVIEEKLNRNEPLTDAEEATRLALLAGKGVPAAPFVTDTKSWVALAIKKAMSYAAEQGLDGVVFATGAQNVEIYKESLRKAVDRVEWTKQENGIRLVGFKNGEQVVDTVEQESNISDAIGKSMGEQIINDPRQAGVLEGDDITVSDTGMAGFYDRIVPQVANDVLRKIGGGRVEGISLRGDVKVQPIGNGTRFSLFNESGDPVGEFSYSSKESAQRAADKYKNVQPGFLITPSMHETILAGLPLFQKETAKGSGTEDLHAAIDRRVADITEEWANAPEVVIVRNIDDEAIPQRVRDYEASQQSRGATGTPEGFYYGGKVYLLTDEISDVGRAVEVLIHETIGHAGLRGVFGDALKPVLRDVSIALRGEVATKAKEYGLDMMKESDRLIAAEEVLAELAQSDPTLNIVQKAIAAIRAWLRKHGFVKTLTDNDIIYQYILPAQGFIKRREVGGESFTVEEAVPLLFRSAALDLMDNFTDSAKTYGPLKGLMTSLHKARLDPEHFGPVFNLAMAFRNDLSRIAYRTWEHAQDVLPAFNEVKGAIRAILHGKDVTDEVARVSKWIFDGTTQGGPSPLDGVRWTPEQLRKQFKATDKEVGIYQQVRESIDSSLVEVANSVAWRLAKPHVKVEVKGMVIGDPSGARDLIIDALNLNLQRAVDGVGYRNDIAAKKAEADIRAALDKVKETYDQADKLIAAGYAPLQRYGRYTVDVYETDERGKIAKDDDGIPRRLEFLKFEYEAEARAAEKKLRAAYANRRDVAIRRGVQAESKLFAGVDPDTVALFVDTVGAIEGIDIKREILDEWRREAISQRSAMTRQIKRKGIAGFSEDLPRVLATFLTSNARYASSNYHMSDMLAAVNKIPDVKGDVKDEADDLYKYINASNEPGAWMRGLMFAWYLGGSPAAALVNMTQPVLMTFPYLSQFGSAGKYLMASAKQAMGRSPIPASIQSALRRAMEEGVVEAQEIHHLYDEGMRPIIARLPGGEDLRARAQGVATLWGAWFGMAENFNRRITFLSAYKMAEEMGNVALKAKGFAGSYDFARKAAEETQGVYSKENRPNWARGTGPLGAVGVMAFTFKQYSIQYVELLLRMYRSGPEGKKAALLMLGLLIIASGLQGVPGADDLDDLIDTVLQSMGYKGNAKKLKRDALRNLAGERMADIVMYGLSAETPLDVQTRLGLGNMLPATGAMKPSETNKARQFSEILGPPGGFAQSVFDFADALQSGKRASAFGAFSPVFIRNIAKAYHMADTGIYTDARGRKVEDVSLADAAIKLVGFQPQSVAAPTRSARMVQQDIARVKGVETDIADIWAEGMFEKDQGKVQRAKDMLRDWNETNPETPIRIEFKQLYKRIQAMKSERSARLMKTTPKEMRRYVSSGLD